MFDWCHGFDPVKLLVQHEISALKKKKWTSEWMCFRVRTRRSEQGTWDGLGPSACYYTKIAGGSTFCIWPVPCWWAGHGAWGTADAPWVTKADYNNAGMVLCVMFTLYWTGLWWEEPSSQLPFQEDPKSCGSNQQHFWKKSRRLPFPLNDFSFPPVRKHHKKPWKPLIEHTG